MAADHELVERLSGVGSRLISIQMGFSNTSLQDARTDAWTLGYCYGVVDAICQASNLAEETEFLLVFTVTLDEIAGGKGELKQGADFVEAALLKLQEPAFQDGLMMGGADFMAYRNNQNIPPMGLANYLREKG